ncbi:hypothetical protein [Mesorhizobium sp. WSM2239]|uniref:Uncharacterized protein n=2 Tax=unclassified Mesorhizobium TaxID=325217 RepID=A0AAU8DFB5_9HYPH
MVKPSFSGRKCVNAINEANGFEDGSQALHGSPRCVAVRRGERPRVGPNFPASQLHERHASDFETRTQDKLAAE